MPDDTARLPRLFWLLRWPIFGKELRVAGRRRRTYVLRSAYVALLTVFVVLVWRSAVRWVGGDLSGVVSQMGEAGKQIIATIAWFQFIATQLVAVIMLSTAISEEVNHRTLDVLMTTPINSFQIVMGKLFAGLWQILILLAISMPLLAIVRIFGGVPWEYVLASLCITFTAVLFAGSLSLLFSVRARRAYAAILRTLLVVLLLYFVLPGLFSLCAFSGPGGGDFLEGILHTNPIFIMTATTESMLSAGTSWVGSFSWLIHCILMLAASVGVLAWATARLRRVATRQTVRRTDRPIAPRRATGQGAATSPPSAGGIRSVTDRPVAWRELRRGLLSTGRVGRIISITALALLLLLVYALCANEDLLDNRGTHVVFFCIYTIVPMVVAAVVPATAVASEKEARSWPILMATPLSEWEILWGKALGVFRRCAPAWCLLAGHVLLFVLVGYIHPIAIPQLAIVAAWVTVFLTGSGLYFSTVCRRTTTAVAMNFAVALTLWLIAPLLLSLSAPRDVRNLCLTVNPCVHVAVIADGAAGKHNARDCLHELDYDWPDSLADSAVETTSRLVKHAMTYTVFAAMLAWLAARRFRRRVF